MASERIGRHGRAWYRAGVKSTNRILRRRKPEAYGLVLAEFGHNIAVRSMELAIASHGHGGHERMMAENRL
jgi:hypothetical protein